MTRPNASAGRNFFGKDETPRHGREVYSQTNFWSVFRKSRTTFGPRSNS